MPTADPRALAQALMSGRTVDPYTQEYPRPQERQGRLAHALMGLRSFPQDMAQGALVVGDIASGVAQWARDNPLDAGALAVSPVPVVGDLAGLANDVRHYATDPESRTWGNYGLSVLGALPLIPSVAGGAAKAAKGMADNVPRKFYRGTTPGDTRRIAEPFEAARGMTFVARKPESAQMYGSSIEEFVAKPDARILTDESPDFWRLVKRRRPPNGYVGSARGGLLDVVNDAVRKAKEAGYDAVSFSSDSDIGTVILNDAMFARSPYSPAGGG